jgi:hypothetical protein
MEQQKQKDVSGQRQHFCPSTHPPMADSPGATSTVLTLLFLIVKEHSVAG